MQRVAMLAVCVIRTRGSFAWRAVRRLIFLDGLDVVQKLDYLIEYVHVLVDKDDGDGKRRSFVDM